MLPSPLRPKYSKASCAESVSPSKKSRKSSGRMLSLVAARGETASHNACGCGSVASNLSPQEEKHSAWCSTNTGTDSCPCCQLLCVVVCCAGLYCTIQVARPHGMTNITMPCPRHKQQTSGLQCKSPVSIAKDIGKQALGKALHLAYMCCLLLGGHAVVPAREAEHPSLGLYRSTTAQGFWHFGILTSRPMHSICHSRHMALINQGAGQSQARDQHSVVDQ